MKLTLKEPGSAITHFVAAIAVIIAAIPLIVKAAGPGNWVSITSLIIFAASMGLLYLCSTIYHSLVINEKINRRLRKLDHMMIFVMIAGSYTPVCMIALERKTGIMLCTAVWIIAVVGILVKALWINCPKWFSSIIYIGMGWVCIFAMPQIYHALTSAQFGWLLAGGIIYTIGGIIYALKLPIFDANHKNFGSHEIFHLFVMGGSACHFVTMFLLI